MRTIIALPTALALLLTPPSAARADSGTAPDEQHRHQPRAAAPEPPEPSLAEVREAALRFAGLDWRPEREWAQRTRLAGLMPVLTVSASSGTAHDQDLSRASSGNEQLEVAIDRDVSFEAKAVWQLDRLLFDETEIRAIQIAQQRHRERQELLAHVTSLYYQRRKLQLVRAPGGNAPDSATRELAIEETAAQLDALTGGYFTRAMHTPQP